MRIGYVPWSPTLNSPADRRRLLFWARERHADVEVYRDGERYDVVYLATTADIARWRRERRGGPKIVYELIDDYLALSRTTPAARLRGAVKFAAHQLSRPVPDYLGAMEDMCRRADAVVCSSPEQRERIEQLCPNTHDILDSHAGLATTVKSDYKLGAVANLVWEGLPYTLDDFLTVAPALRDLAGRRPLALHLVTDLRYHRVAKRFISRETAELARRILPNAYLYEWNDLLLAPIVTACDLAVIPLDLEDPLARGKPENKLLLLWSMGMPVVASATPSYQRVMSAAEAQSACTTVDEWAATLDDVLDDEERRATLGRRGRAYVADHHRDEDLLERWDALFASLT